MTSYFSNLVLKIKRKFGYPEVAILVTGNNTPAARNRFRLILSNTKIRDFLVESAFVELPISDKFTFKPKQFDPFEGILYLIDATKEELIKYERNFLWEKLLWNEHANSLPIAFCAYNSDLQGALTRGELIENLSLIRITDRVWELFETPSVEQLVEALYWLRKVIHMGYVKPWEKKEGLLEKMTLREMQLEAEKSQITTNS